MKNWRLYPSDVSDEIWVFVTLLDPVRGKPRPSGRGGCQVAQWSVAIVMSDWVITDSRFVSTPPAPSSIGTGYGGAK